ncbi:MAG: hypothetical protein K8963_06275, partial [Proteobacteria bacterium]|nr:hypothetical protein [Pseudomonadota bacterium]
LTLTLTTDVTRNACTIDSTPDTLGTATLRIRADVGAFMSNVVTLTFTIERQSNDITIAPATASIRFDETPTPNTATADSGSTAFTWSSSNTAVATIDASTGVITLVSAGMTMIEASTAQTATHKAGSGRYTLTVTPFPPILPTEAIMATAVSGIALADATIIANQPGGAEITGCKFINSASDEVASLDGLTIAKAADNAACEITGTVTGTGTSTYTIRATSAGGGMADGSVIYTFRAPVLAMLSVTPAEVDGTLNEAITETIITNSISAAALTAGSCVLLEPTGTTALDETTPGSNTYTLNGLTLATNVATNNCTVNGSPDTLGATILRIRANTADGMSAVFELTVYGREVDMLSFAMSTVTITDDIVPPNPLTATSLTTTFAWTSSDLEVATIDDTTGAITITGAGTTTITATSLQSDTHTPGSISYTLTVTAFAPMLPSLIIQATAIDGIPLAEPVLIPNADGGADIQQCTFTENVMTTFRGLTVTTAVDGRSCEVTGTLTGEGVMSPIFISANSATGFDSAGVIFTVLKPLGLVRQVDSGVDHTCAVTTDDELYCWGLGDNGRLGLTDINGRNIPTKVGTTANWTQVSAGGSHTCAVNTDGELYCWGSG